MINTLESVGVALDMICDLLQSKSCPTPNDYTAVRDYIYSIEEYIPVDISFPLNVILSEVKRLQTT